MENQRVYLENRYGGPMNAYRLQGIFLGQRSEHPDEISVAYRIGDRIVVNSIHFMDEEAFQIRTKEDTVLITYSCTSESIKSTRGSLEGEPLIQKCDDLLKEAGL